MLLTSVLNVNFPVVAEWSFVFSRYCTVHSEPKDFNFGLSPCRQKMYPLELADCHMNNTSHEQNQDLINSVNFSFANPSQALSTRKSSIYFGEEVGRFYNVHVLILKQILMPYLR